MGPKIATCCYCGTRAALTLSEAGRHELSCTACGAPLHELKWLPRPKPAKEAHRGNTSLPLRSAPKPSKSKKKRRGFSYRKALEELFDVVEDILD